MNKSVLVFYKTNEGPLIHFLHKGEEQISTFEENNFFSHDLLKAVEGVSKRFDIKRTHQKNYQSYLRNKSGWCFLPIREARILLVNGRVKVGKPLPLFVDVLFLGKSVWLDGLSNLNRNSIGVVILENGMPSKRKKYFKRIFKNSSIRIIDLSDGGQLVLLE